MANVKVTLGGETRRFIASTELSYDELVKKVSNLFPALRESSPNLQLTYQDEDGDLVTLSSDEEIVAATSAIAPEQTWRLQAKQIRPTTTKTSPNSLLFPLLGASHLLQPSWGHHGLLDPFSLNSHNALLSDGVRLFEKLRVAEEKASSEHKASQQKQAQQETSASKEEQERAKPAMKTAQKPSSTCNRTCSCSHKSWRPVVVESPFWSSSLLGPLGYEIHCSWSPETNQKEETRNSSSEQPGANQTQPEPAEERKEESASDQPLEEPRKEEESQSGEATPTTTESTSA